ncbi:MAG: hypothetical protein A3G13_02360 [Candidatus Levybacteria bacterium RIFCSPLOWO2_12_FULL_37_7]|nr:MAG: hypothetical protein A3G13_02360 [Candidatus Levybacteria bacterium RIFCSPLOWO2_12_FULL_37_7]
MNLARNPKIQLAITLFFIYLTSLFNNFSTQNLLIFIISVVSCIISDLVFLRIGKKPIFFPSAALVIGLILTLVVSPNLPWFAISIIGILAVVSKNFLRFNSRHIFNPAAFGLIIGSLFFEHTVSWWGVSSQQFRIQNLEFIIPFLILLSPGLISQYRIKRFRITLFFLVVYFIFQIIFNAKYFFDPTILFFSLVMLPEPMTTPNNHTRQIIFGTFIAVFSILISFPIFHFLLLTFNSSDPLLLSLLIGNLIFFKLK